MGDERISDLLLAMRSLRSSEGLDRVSDLVTVMAGKSPPATTHVKFTDPADGDYIRSLFLSSNVVIPKPVVQVSSSTASSSSVSSPVIPVVRPVSPPFSASMVSPLVVSAGLHSQSRRSAGVTVTAVATLGGNLLHWDTCLKSTSGKLIKFGSLDWGELNVPSGFYVVKVDPQGNIFRGDITRNSVWLGGGEVDVFVRAVRELADSMSEYV